MTKCPSSIWRQDSNPQPFEHESSPITTRPGLLPIAVWYQTGRWKLRPGRWACAASLRLKLSSDQIITSMLYLSHRKKAMKKVKRLFVDDLENCCFYESVGKTKINKFIYKINVNTKSICPIVFLLFSWNFSKFEALLFPSNFLFIFAFLTRKGNHRSVCNIISVTRFGEIPSLWQIFKNLWQYI